MGALIVMPFPNNFNEHDMVAAIELAIEELGDCSLLCLVAERETLLSVADILPSFPAGLFWGGIHDDKMLVANFVYAIGQLFPNTGDIYLVDESLEIKKALVDDNKMLSRSLKNLVEGQRAFNLVAMAHSVKQLKLLQKGAFFGPERLFLGAANYIDSFLECVFSGGGWLDPVSSKVKMSEASRSLEALCSFSRWNATAKRMMQWADAAESRAGFNLHHWRSKLKDVVVITNSLRLSSLDSVDAEDLSKICRWYSAFFLMLSKLFSAMGMFSVGYVYAFRAMEYGVDATLIANGVLKLQPIAGRAAFCIGQKKVFGFAERWARFKDLMRECDVKIGRNSYDGHINFRNSLDLAHGFVASGEAISARFLAEVWELIDILDGAFFQNFDIGRMSAKLESVFFPDIIDWLLSSFKNQTIGYSK